MVAQDIVGAAAHEDARLARRKVANHVALDFEQSIVRQHVGHRGVVAAEGGAQIVDQRRKHAARLPLVGLLEVFGTDAALVGSQQDKLLVVHPDAEPPGEDFADGLAAAAELTAYVDYEFFHETIV